MHQAWRQRTQQRQSQSLSTSWPISCAPAGTTAPPAWAQSAALALGCSIGPNSHAELHYTPDCAAARAHPSCYLPT